MKEKFELIDKNLESKNIDNTQKNIEEINKERIALLENLKIGSSQKVDIMLVVLGFKPATELDIYKYNDDEEKIKNVLKNIGLLAEKKDTLGQKNVLAKIAIVRDREILNSLLKISSKKDHEIYGRLMGYPESAIQAFLNKDFYNERSVIFKDNIFFFKLSKENWREEFKVLSKWNNAIKKYSPLTHQKVIGIDKNRK